MCCCVFLFIYLFFNFSQVELLFQKGGYVYPQCFLPSSRLVNTTDILRVLHNFFFFVKLNSLAKLMSLFLIWVGFLQRARASRHREPSTKWNSGNVLKSSEQSRSWSSQIPAGISRASSVDQRSGLGSGVGWSYLNSWILWILNSPHSLLGITLLTHHLEETGHCIFSLIVSLVYGFGDDKHDTCICCSWHDNNPKPCRSQLDHKQSCLMIHFPLGTSASQRWLKREVWHVFLFKNGHLLLFYWCFLSSHCRGTCSLMNNLTLNNRWRVGRHSLLM